MTEPTEPQPVALTERQRQAQADREQHERWKQAVAEHEARKLAERREQDERATKSLQAISARLLGQAADDGTGHCRWCRIRLGRDAEGHRTHVEPERCPGPTPDPCTLCGGPAMRTEAGRWEHVCTARPAKPAAGTQLERVRQGPGMVGDSLGGLFGRRQLPEG